MWFTRRPLLGFSWETLKYLEPSSPREQRVRLTTHIHGNATHLAGLTQPHVERFGSCSHRFLKSGVFPEGRSVSWTGLSLTHRCKHGDAGPPCIVGSGPELRPRHRARDWKLLWGSRVYVVPLHFWAQGVWLELLHSRLVSHYNSVSQCKVNNLTSKVKRGETMN